MSEIKSLAGISWRIGSIHVRSYDTWCEPGWVDSQSAQLRWVSPVRQRRTQLVNNPVPQAVYGVHLVPTFFTLASSPQIHVYTSEPSTRWPDLHTLGIEFPQLTQTVYQVSVGAEGPYATMDDATGIGGLSARRSTQYCCIVDSQAQCYASAESDSIGTQEYWKIDSLALDFPVRVAAEASKYHCSFEEHDFRPGEMIYQCLKRRCGCAVIDGRGQPYCSDGYVLEPRSKGSRNSCWPGDTCCLIMQAMRRAVGGR